MYVILYLVWSSSGMDTFCLLDCCSMFVMKNENYEYSSHEWVQLWCLCGCAVCWWERGLSKEAALWTGGAVRVKEGSIDRRKASPVFTRENEALYRAQQRFSTAQTRFLSHRASMWGMFNCTYWKAATTSSDRQRAIADTLNSSTALQI